MNFSTIILQGITYLCLQGSPALHKILGDGGEGDALLSQGDIYRLMRYKSENGNEF